MKLIVSLYTKKHKKLLKTQAVRINSTQLNYTSATTKYLFNKAVQFNVGLYVVEQITSALVELIFNQLVFLSCSKSCNKHNSQN